MIILAIDTTTLTGSIALLKDTKLIAEVDIDSSSTYSERLLPAVDFLLKTNQLSIQDMDGFAVSVGPGSFTGIRIGLSTVKSFSYASGKPVAGVSTLKALAEKLRRSQAHLLCPIGLGVVGPGDMKTSSGVISSRRSSGKPFRNVITSAPVWRT